LIISKIYFVNYLLTSLVFVSAKNRTYESQRFKDKESDLTLVGHPVEEREKNKDASVTAYPFLTF